MLFGCGGFEGKSGSDLQVLDSGGPARYASDMRENEILAGFRLDVELDDAGPRRDQLKEQLRSFNNRISPAHLAVRAPGQVLALDLYLMDDAQEIAAGLTSDTYWDWWNILTLWVRDDLRGRRIGTELLARGEQEARGRGSRHAQLHTFSFQAPGFYEKHGFHVIGQLEDYPLGQSFIWLRKELE